MSPSHKRHCAQSLPEESSLQVQETISDQNKRKAQRDSESIGMCVSAVQLNGHWCLPGKIEF